MIARGQDGLAKRAHELFRDLVGDWIERCDLALPGAGHLAWNSYAIATRLQWWALIGLELFPQWSDHREFAAAFLQSFFRQAEHLAGNIEWDLRGNHLVRDALGLAYAGLFGCILGVAESDKWLRMAAELADEQSAEQVLPDGGHFERSPMYHRHVLHDFEMVSRICSGATRERVQRTVSRMHDFADWTLHPDGGLALFNDAALDEERPPIPTRLVGTAARPRGGRHFADTGLAVWHGQKWTIFFDVGPVGPDYQPGHGHADNLTLECSYARERLFVDPGTHSYDRDERRAYDRSTAAHNTVCVDETDSSEVWHIFRVGRRARPIDVNVIANDTQFDASAAHDGYKHLGGVIHRRRAQLARDETLAITDQIEGNGSHRLEGGWLLAPGWTATPAENGWRLEREGTAVPLYIQGPPELRLSIETRPWHPRFGVEIPTTRLTWRWQGPLPFQLTTTVAPS
jgi:uncharacterized heparinase superfamily protein